MPTTITSADATPASQKDLVRANEVFRTGEADAVARAETNVQEHIASHPELMAIDPKERQAAHG